MKCKDLFAAGGIRAPGPSHPYPFWPEHWARIPRREDVLEHVFMVVGSTLILKPVADPFWEVGLEPLDLTAPRANPPSGAKCAVSSGRSRLSRSFWLKRSLEVNMVDLCSYPPVVLILQDPLPGLQCWGKLFTWRWGLRRHRAPCFLGSRFPINSSRPSFSSFLPFSMMW